MSFFNSALRSTVEPFSSPNTAFSFCPNPEAREKRTDSLSIIDNHGVGYLGMARYFNVHS